MEWGAVLKTARKRERLTQEQLAEKLHLTKSCISKFEHNEKEAKISLFIAWFKHTNAQDLMLATLIAADPTVSQMIEGINQLSQIIGFIKLF